MSSKDLKIDVLGEYSLDHSKILLIFLNYRVEVSYHPKI